MNPITQRTSTSNQQNGFGPQLKGIGPKTTMSPDSRSVDQFTQERMLYWLGNFMVIRDLSTPQIVSTSSDEHVLQ